MAVFLAALVMTVTVPPASADEIDDAASDAAVTWLAGQATAAYALEERIDLALAFLVAGAPEDSVDRLLDGIEFLVGQGVELSTRELAKTIVALDVAGRPLVVSGSGANADTRNLEAELRARVGDPPDAAGRYRADFGDELSTQAWGILAELRLGAAPQPETMYLLSRQCDGGTFVITPTIQSCGQPVDVVDQALVLSALVAADAAGLGGSDAAQRLLAWFETAWNPDDPAGPNLGVSALAWLVAPLEALGRAEMAADARGRIRSLQLTAEAALYDGQVGAIGGESELLLQDLLARRLDPAAGLTMSAILGLRGVDLTDTSFAPRTTLDDLPAPGPGVVGVAIADPGEAASFLVQGFAPDEMISLTIAGMSGTVATATTDDAGSAVLTFTTRALDSVGQDLTFTGESGERVATRLSVTRPLVDATDSSAGPVRAQSDPFELTLAQAVGAAGLVVLTLFGGAWLLRPRD